MTYGRVTICNISRDSARENAIVLQYRVSHVGVVTFSPVHGEVLCEFKDRLYVNAVCMKTMTYMYTLPPRSKMTSRYYSTYGKKVG